MLLALISLWESLSAYPGASPGRCWSWHMSHSCLVSTEASQLWLCPLGIFSPFDPCSSSIFSRSKVWLCAFFPATSLQSPLVLSSKRDESITYRLCWTGTACLFSFCNILFLQYNSIFLHALSFVIHKELDQDLLYILSNKSFQDLFQPYVAAVSC